MSETSLIGAEKQRLIVLFGSNLSLRHAPHLRLDITQEPLREGEGQILKASSN
jgi:hypothetical protein